MRPETFIVAGAGNIGCYLGGYLLAAGHDVRFLGRPRVVDELRQHGLSLTDCDGGERRVDAQRVVADSDPALLGPATAVLVAVKSGATAEMANIIRAHAPASARIVSLQNGVGNVAVLRQILPDHHVIAGMVPFNVVSAGDGHFHRATGGELVIEDGPDWIGRAFAESGIATHASVDMESVAWGKLLINLNNALNALSGLPLAEQLNDRAWRRLLAQCMSEALRALDAANIQPVRVTPVNPRLLPWIMRSPNWLYSRITRRQIRIDPKARSSMWDDLERRRATEIDYLQGAVVDLARRHGLVAPTNERILRLVHVAEREARGSPRLDAEKILHARD